MNVDRSQSVTDVDPSKLPDLSSFWASPPAYRFLRPPQQAGEMGRLGEYRVIRLLGQGGTAFVFLAEDLHLQRRVALKVMKPTLDHDPSAYQRFLREARTLAVINHDYVVRVYQVAQEDATIFLAMEWLQGQTLHDWVAQNGPPEITTTLRLAREIAAGLEVLHGNGLIHRDLKPNNLWLEEPGQRIKLLDFGMVRPIEDKEHFTASGFIVGTPAFMSPEQARGERIDARTDLFSLGGVLYYLCSGKLPFRAATSVGTITSVVLDQPQPIDEVNPHVPQPLAKLIMQLLEKKAEHRPQSAQDVIRRLEALEELLISPQASSATQLRCEQAVASERTQLTNRFAPAPKPIEVVQKQRRSKRSVLGAGLALAIVSLVTAGLYFGVVDPAGNSAQAGKPIPELNAANADSTVQTVVLPNEKPKSQGILVLDDCDDRVRGKEQTYDKLTHLDLTGNTTFRVSGFSSCSSVSSSRMIAVDPRRDSIWVVENAARRLRRFDLSGKVALTIDDVDGSAIAVDAQNGNVWALVGKGMFGTGKTVVYDHQGNLVATYPFRGWDIAYDVKARAFWITSPHLTKIAADSGEVLLSCKVAGWHASSLDVDPNSGAVWLGVRSLLEGPESANQLLKFDPNGQQEVAVDLGKKIPFKVSVDRTNGSVWVAHFRNAVERFSADGKSEAEYAVAALAVQADPLGSAVWIVTPDEIQKMTAKGLVTKRVRHACTTAQAWIAAYD